MPRKPRENTDIPAKKQSHSINVSPDIAEMLGIISARRKTTVKDIVEGWIRPLVVKSYLDVMKELNEMSQKLDK
jgi:hypothetical protein